MVGRSLHPLTKVRMVTKMKIKSIQLRASFPWNILNQPKRLNEFPVGTEVIFLHRSEYGGCSLETATVHGFPDNSVAMVYLKLEDGSTKSVSIGGVFLKSDFI